MVNKESKSKQRIILIIGFIIIAWIINIRYQYRKRNKIDNQINNQIEHFDNEVPKMDRPFLNIYDNNNNKINVVFITHPFSREESYQKYEDAKKNNIHFIGISSYSEFPGLMTNPHDPMSSPNHDAWKYNYFDLVKGWCHCFRHPYQYFGTTRIPKLLLSESDFPNFEKLHPKPNIEKKYDFMYVCLKDNDKCEDGWQAYNRNWELGRKCIEIMCQKYHMKGLLIGRINCEMPEGCHQLMELTDKLEWSKFIEMYHQCRFLFLPNQTDASPRVLTEALCCDMPALVNYNIVGGWKYINDETGKFFVDEHDFENALPTFINQLNGNKYSPRQYMVHNYGVRHSGVQLLNFIKRCIPIDELNFDCDKVKYLKPGV